VGFWNSWNRAYALNCIEQAFLAEDHVSALLWTVMPYHNLNHASTRPHGKYAKLCKRV
jgi:hypothetical protein